MATVTIRELGRNASSVVEEVRTANAPTLVSKHGTVVAALVPIADNVLEDWVLNTYLEESGIFDEAERDLREGNVISAADAAAELDEE